MIKKIFQYLQKIKQEISSVVAEEDILTSAISAINGDNTQFNVLRNKQDYYATHSNTNFSLISTFYATCYGKLKTINFFRRNKQP